MSKTVRKASQMSARKVMGKPVTSGPVVKIERPKVKEVEETVSQENFSLDVMKLS